MLPRSPDEISELLRPVDKIFFVKNTFSQSAEEPRHSILEYLPPRTEQRSFRVERTAERNKIGFVATSAMQQEECARRLARYKPVSEIERSCTHTAPFLRTVLGSNPPSIRAYELSIQGGRNRFVPSSFGDLSSFLCGSAAMAMM